jgi:phosphoglycolate phosphatase
MMTEHRFRLIVFDVDGTLVDSQQGIVAAMTRTFEALGLAAPDADTTRRVVGLSLDEAIGRLLPPDASPELIARGADLYKEAFIAERRRPDYHEPLYPNVAEMLHALDTPEVCLGVATGKSRKGLDVTLDRHGLAGHFVTLQTADHGPGKPHPRMLRTAMADVGADPSETVLIGDTVFDMEMAGNAGTAALGVSWGYHDAVDLTASGARQVLERITDLPAALREMSL